MGKQIFVVEARKEDGSLDVKRVGTEPIQEGTEDQIFNYYFSQHKEKSSASWLEVIDFYHSKGFTIRKKYW
jgi:hypothetical protein